MSYYVKLYEGDDQGRRTGDVRKIRVLSCSETSRPRRQDMGVDDRGRGKGNNQSWMERPSL